MSKDQASDGTDTDVQRRKFAGAFRALAYVEPEYYVTPNELEFVADRPGEITLRVMRNQESTLNTNSRLRVVDFGANHEAIRMERFDLQNGDIGTLRVHFDPSLWHAATDGPLSTVQVTLVVNSEHEPTFVVPVIIRAAS